MRVLVSMVYLLMTACSQALPYEIEGDAILAPLSFNPASTENGQMLFSTRTEAHCVLCHAHAKADVPFPGNMGPDLTEVQTRLTEGQIRLRIVDYEQINPGTTMPSYFRTHDLHQLTTEKKGQTVLTAREIEDIIAFLMEPQRD